MILKIEKMNMDIKSLKIIAFFLLLGQVAFGQQDVQYTQFMHNKLAINPAYAGSTGVPCMNALYRNQWSGFQGAPVSQTLGYQMPLFKDRVGAGISLVHDRLGPTESWSASMIYAYHIPLVKKLKLGIGVQGSLQNYRVNWDETEATHEGDLAIPDLASGSKLIPNFGAGLHLHSDRFYVGISVPHLLRTRLSLQGEEYSVADINRAEVHGFFMAGAIFDLSNDIKLKPAGLIKYTKNAPIDFDLHASLIFFEQFWIGGTYRAGGELQGSSGESIDAIVQLQITDAIRVGFSYDFTLTEIGDHTPGSYEIVIDYCFHYKGKRLTNPRFF